MKRAGWSPVFSGFPVFESFSRDGECLGVCVSTWASWPSLVAVASQARRLHPSSTAHSPQPDSSSIAVSSAIRFAMGPPVGTPVCLGAAERRGWWETSVALGCHGRCVRWRFCMESSSGFCKQSFLRVLVVLQAVCCPELSEHASSALGHGHVTP